MPSEGEIEQAPESRVRPLGVLLRSIVEGMGWGAIASAAYGALLVVVVISVATLTDGIDDPDSVILIFLTATMVVAVYGLFIGLGQGFLVGFVVGATLASVAAIDSGTSRPSPSVARIIGATEAFVIVAATGAAFVFAFNGGLSGLQDEVERVSAWALVRWFGSISIVPGLIAGAIFAWRTPIIVRISRLPRPPLARPDQRRATAAT
ncbi:MAG: hypothetical protein ABI720_12095 [Actinomycetes bacterium]